MANAKDPPLDEIQWRSPQIVENMGGLHSNNILFYFAESPFFERTSNNAVVLAQAMNNSQMFHFIQTREAFEGRLKTMVGLEFIVGEEPAETGPGMGTGVWVIRKQTRKKGYQGEDEITLHASYFVVGDNIYMAPTLADILASRIMTMSSAIAKALPAAESIRKWRPSTGHIYRLPDQKNPATSKSKSLGSKEATPLPDALEKATPALNKFDELSLERVAEEAFITHMKYGGEYIDENPITGRPGEFHHTSTGRRAMPQPPPQTETPVGIGAMNGPPRINTKLDDKKEGKSEKTPKSATFPKPKRRKSRISTPAAS